MEWCTSIRAATRHLRSLFAQVRDTFVPYLRFLGNILTPECTIRIDEITVHDIEEPDLEPALPRPRQVLVLQRARALRAHRAPALRRSTCRFDGLVDARRELRGDDLQVRLGTPVCGCDRWHQDLQPRTGHTAARHLQQPLPDQPVHHLGRLHQRAADQPRDRRVRPIEPGRYCPAHQGHPAIRACRQHQTE
ncbi:hypothetical protein [Kitasatospora sp. NPDC051164]|uniref:hypothetical protein n=1 Tax=Kitasatospora sp. NPDC051164 TaxID=3364055 RepID=UPI0037A54D48